MPTYFLTLLLTSASEIWSLNRENELALHWTEKKRIISWICGVKLRDKLPCIELRQQLGIEDIAKVVHRNRLQRYDMFLREDDDDWARKMCYFE